AAFWSTVRRHRDATPLREAALRGRLGDWTAALTSVAVAACEELGWRASAKGHLLDLLPVPRGEYLAMDLTAFAGGEKRWRFPTAVMEGTGDGSTTVVQSGDAAGGPAGEQAARRLRVRGAS